MLWNLPAATAAQLQLLGLQRAGHVLKPAPPVNLLRRILRAFARP